MWASDLMVSNVFQRGFPTPNHTLVHVRHLQASAGAACVRCGIADIIVVYAIVVHAATTMEAGDRRMAEAAESKRERVHLRVDARSKRTLERAAAYEDTTVSQFVARNAVAAAERVIEARERIVLPATDWDAFHDALLNPPAPNAALRRAARRYRERIRG